MYQVKLIRGSNVRDVAEILPNLVLKKIKKHKDHNHHHDLDSCGPCGQFFRQKIITEIHMGYKSSFRERDKCELKTKPGCPSRGGGGGWQTHWRTLFPQQWNPKPSQRPACPFSTKNFPESRYVLPCHRQSFARPCKSYWGCSKMIFPAHPTLFARTTRSLPDW